MCESASADAGTQALPQKLGSRIRGNERVKRLYKTITLWFCSWFLFSLFDFSSRPAMSLAPARPRAASPHDSRPTTDVRPPRARAAIFRQASPSP